MPSQSVFLHASRPEWGVGLIAWEREGKRGYQFEDGHLRVFTSGYYHLLDATVVSTERVRTLRALVGLPPPIEATSLPAPTRQPPSIDEQIEYFVRVYPGGFAAEKWRSERRGAPGRARKRHRDAAIALIRNELTSEYLATCLDRGREQEAMATLATVLGQTDLVASGQLKRLAALPVNRARVVLRALVDLLFGGAAAEVRIVQWVQALARGTGRKPAWSLATAPLALLSPDEHVCVHRPSFLAQAASMAPRLKVRGSPTGVDYPPLLALAHAVRARLDEAGCSPADFLDVHDFMSFTLRPEAFREIAARR